MGMQKKIEEMMDEFIKVYPTLANPAKRELLEHTLFCHFMMMHLKKNIMDRIDNPDGYETKEDVMETLKWQKEYRDFHQSYRTGLQKLGLVASKQSRMADNPEKAGVLGPLELIRRKKGQNFKADRATEDETE